MSTARGQKSTRFRRVLLAEDEIRHTNESLFRVLSIGSDSVAEPSLNQNSLYRRNFRTWRNSRKIVSTPPQQVLGRSHKVAGLCLNPALGVAGPQMPPLDQAHVIDACPLMPPPRRQTPISSRQSDLAPEVMPEPGARCQIREPGTSHLGGILPRYDAARSGSVVRVRGSMVSDLVSDRGWLMGSPGRDRCWTGKQVSSPA